MMDNISWNFFPTTNIQQIFTSEYIVESHVSGVKIESLQIVEEFEYWASSFQRQLWQWMKQMYKMNAPLLETERSDVIPNWKIWCTWCAAAAGRCSLGSVTVRSRSKTWSVWLWEVSASDRWLHAPESIPQTQQKQVHFCLSWNPVVNMDSLL